ncbi:uncharacterized protein L199_006362 [Kwoniella botswanensis]|uniref:uncharacterized protein n=1 Tax=Kwoniella botswanensis TaxID=1268659 RepID=UPI00315CF9C7
MGQQNSKSSTFVDFEPALTSAHPPTSPSQTFSAFPSSGPDPFHHSPPPHRITSPTPQPCSPAFYHAPHSAPVVPVTTKPKGLIRSLSAKRRGESRRPSGSEIEPELPPVGNIKALKTLGQVDLKASMREFEELVQKAEIDAGIRAPSPPTQEQISSTFPKRSQNIKRGSIHHQTYDNSPIPRLSATPAYLRPTPYRRNSSASSIHSSRVSIKSARRAEREWRAKVAALSSGLSPSTSTSIPGNTPPKNTIKIKGGPVPPKRTPMSTSAHAMSQTSRSTSPLYTEEEGTIIVTPPRPAPQSFGTPLSNKSFETLGHYPNSSTVLDSPTPISATEWEGRSRKPSVPHSAYSSVYSTLRDEDGMARPISFASGQWLAPVNSSPLKIDITSTQNTEDEGVLLSANSVCVNGTPTPDSPHRDNLPPFESFKSSPRMVGNSVLPTVETPTKMKHHSLPSPPRPTTQPKRRPSLHIPSLEIPNSPPTLPPLAFSAPSTPGLVTPTKPILSTPTRGVEEPSTPYSPITAYILSAPSPSIDQLAFSTSYGAFVPSPIRKTTSTSAEVNEDSPKTPVRKHPFTFGAKPSPEPITINRESSADGQNAGMSIIPRRNHVNHNSSSYIPRSLPSTNHAQVQNNALRPKNHLQNIPMPIKSNIIGTGTDSRYAKEPGLRRLRGKVDLTPGMENGCRPPKSGLPMADLERWLQNTSI